MASKPQESHPALRRSITRGPEKKKLFLDLTPLTRANTAAVPSNQNTATNAIPSIPQVQSQPAAPAREKRVRSLSLTHAQTKNVIAPSRNAFMQNTTTPASEKPTLPPIPPPKPSALSSLRGFLVNNPNPDVPVRKENPLFQADISSISSREKESKLSAATSNPTVSKVCPNAVNPVTARPQLQFRRGSASPALTSPPPTVTPSKPIAISTGSATSPLSSPSSSPLSSPLSFSPSSSRPPRPPRPPRSTKGNSSPLSSPLSQPLPVSSAHQKKVLDEILSTERDYVNHLTNLIEHFLVPLEKLAVPTSAGSASSVHSSNTGNIGYINSDIGATIAPLIKAAKLILGIQKLFLLDLANAILPSPTLKQTAPLSPSSRSCPTSAVAALFLEFSPFVMIYRDYVNHYYTFQSQFTGLPKSQKTTIENKLKMNANSALGLSDLLVMPIQRVPRYSLLLKALNCPDGNIASRKMQEVAEELERSANRDGVGRERNGKNISALARLMELSRQIKLQEGTKINLVAPHRKLLHETDVIVRVTDGKSGHINYSDEDEADIVSFTKNWAGATANRFNEEMEEKSTSCHLVVMSDMLMWLVREDDSTLTYGSSSEDERKRKSDSKGKKKKKSKKEKKGKKKDGDSDEESNITYTLFSMNSDIGGMAVTRIGHREINLTFGQSPRTLSSGEISSVSSNGSTSSCLSASSSSISASRSLSIFIPDRHMADQLHHVLVDLVDMNTKTAASRRCIPLETANSGKTPPTPPPLPSHHTTTSSYSGIDLTYTSSEEDEAEAEDESEDTRSCTTISMTDEDHDLDCLSCESNDEGTAASPLGRLWSPRKTLKSPRSGTLSPRFSYHQPNKAAVELPLKANTPVTMSSPCLSQTSVYSGVLTSPRLKNQSPLRTCGTPQVLINTSTSRQSCSMSNIPIGKPPITSPRYQRASFAPLPPPIAPLQSPQSSCHWSSSSSSSSSCCTSSSSPSNSSSRITVSSKQL